MVALPLQILTSSARVSGSLRCVDMAPVLFGKNIYIYIYMLPSMIRWRNVTYTNQKINIDQIINESNQEMNL